MPQRRIAVLLVTAAAVLLVAWLVLGRGGGDAPSSRPVPEAGSKFGASTQTEAPPAPAPPPPTSAGTAERQAAGLLLVGFGGRAASDAGARRLSARPWGGIVLQDSNLGRPAGVRALVRGIAGAARKAREPAPLVLATGDVAQSAAALVPQNEVANPQAARTAAERAGRRLRALGIGAVLAPSADIGYAGGAWEGRAYSDDPATVRALAGAAVEGWSAAHVVPAVGHFPGEGAASGDPTVAPATVGLSLADLRRADLVPFAAVARSAPAIQMSSALYAAWDGVTPATLLPDAVRLLRGTGFRGTVVSADLNAVVAAVGGTVGEAAVAALKAGCDLVYLPGDAADQDATVRAVADAIRGGRLAPARVREALARVTALRALTNA